MRDPAAPPTRDALPVGKKDCQRGVQSPGITSTAAASARAQSKTGKESIKCYNCGQRGHFTTRCPSNAMFSDSATSEFGTPLHEVSREGTIEGTLVTDMLLDSRTSRTMARLDLVPKGKVVEVEVLNKCAHGDRVKYPLADVCIETCGKRIIARVAVARRLPVSAILGQDVPDMLQLLKGMERLCWLILPEHKHGLKLK